MNTLIAKKAAAVLLLSRLVYPLAIAAGLLVRELALATVWMVAVHNSQDPYAADIYLARSSDGGRTWSAPIKPYLDPARIYDAQMSLASLPDAGVD